MELKHFTKVEEGGKEKFCRRKCKQVGRRIWRRRNRIKTFYKSRRKRKRRVLQKQASGQGGSGEEEIELKHFTKTEEG